MELNKLPKVDRVVGDDALRAERAELGPRVLTSIAREVIADWRSRVKGGEPAPAPASVVAEVKAWARRRRQGRIQRVINATGVLLHTNLGRAPLPAASLERLAEVARGYCSVELDVELGERSRRGAPHEATLAELVGAEDALIVNNNAAAVLLVLSALGAGREIIVSRGELVEIGGGFRIPEVLARSGARMVEVGTTNRTRVGDYEAAVSDRTAAILRVHPSNFRVVGFTERPELAALAKLAHARGLPLVKDLGGGLLAVAEQTGPAELRPEPSVERCIAAGADLVCFSLDKLFGGPQGGVVVGSRAWVSRLRKDPLARALRVDKLTLTALEPVLSAYARGDLAAIPVHQRLGVSLASLRQRVDGWQAELGELARHTHVVDTQAAVGGGTLAEAPLPSVALAVRPSAGASADQLAGALRRADPPVVGRVADDELLLDARSVLPGEDS